ncbi:MAG: TIGR04283 family arsenosugar biosynthesis glycosyltransferase [Alphaproteobacteria bacterium]|nr:TIGR04283 family arsenosugar biosynthesis glycosyltransferase [Alphaproteobacteria bacterium]
MITVVIPTLDAAATLPSALGALIPATVNGLVKEVIVVDGGSTDDTLAIAEEMGARTLLGERGRGSQLAQGGAAARADWILFLHADTVLSPGWEAEARSLMSRTGAGQGARGEVAAAFRFALDDASHKARRLERMVERRCRLLGLPYGDQGLLIPRAFYERLGGYRPVPLMEDVDIVQRIGRKRLVMMRSEAVTSAERYLRDGYTWRPLRNLALLTLYMLRVPPAVLARLYG